MNEYLPAIVLPNLYNQQDATAVRANGEEVSLSEFLRSLDSVQHLRFMIQGSDPRSTQDPRITWQRQQAGHLLVVAAFAVDTDTHERVVSASVIFELSDEAWFQHKLIAQLGSTNEKELQKFFTEHLKEIRDEIDRQIYQGMTGGECDLKKKFAYRPGRKFHGSR